MQSLTLDLLAATVYSEGANLLLHQVVVGDHLHIAAIAATIIAEVFFNWCFGHHSHLDYFNNFVHYCYWNYSIITTTVKVSIY